MLTVRLVNTPSRRTLPFGPRRSLGRQQRVPRSAYRLDGHVDQPLPGQLVQPFMARLVVAQHLVRAKSSRRSLLMRIAGDDDAWSRSQPWRPAMR